VRLLPDLRIGSASGLTSVSSHVGGIHLDIIVAIQPSVGIIHPLDRAGQDVKRGGTLVLRDWGGFQLGVPRIGESDGTVRRERWIRDRFTKRGEREVEFRSDWLEEFGVDIDHLRERAETPD